MQQPANNVNYFHSNWPELIAITGTAVEMRFGALCLCIGERKHN